MERYDAVIIGAGMSGLAAGIRLAHFGKKVCLLERHYAPGGLNSFYAKDGRKYDVGLHAMTNFVRAESKDRKAALNRILRQLRISRDDLGLREQKRSRVAFPEADLAFSNDFELLQSEVAKVFPHQIDGFRSLVQAVKSCDIDDMSADFISAREVVRDCISDPLLEDMLFCPLMYYGSATPRDMDFSQFAVMFRSIFLEGLARPLEGIRPVIKILLNRFRESGGIRRMKTGVSRIELEGNRAVALELDNGEKIKAGAILSSAGLSETLKLCGKGDDMSDDSQAFAERLSFVETISVFSEPLDSFGWDEDTIVFFNAAERFSYELPQDAVDLRSGVICLPNNFDYGENCMPEGVARMTCLANYKLWKSYSKDDYVLEKKKWFDRIWQAGLEFLPPTSNDPLSYQVAADMFTPTTVERYTWHRHGAIYGSPQKRKDGRIGLENVFLCGTDQGFLGIVGSMISGIAMANQHVLAGGR